MRNVFSERWSHTTSNFFETNLNKIKHHFSGNKGAWAKRRINELTILTANYNFTENLASQRPKLSLFSSLLLTPRPQKNRRGKAQRFLGNIILRMYFIFLSTQSLFRTNIYRVPLAARAWSQKNRYHLEMIFSFIPFSFLIWGANNPLQSFYRPVNRPLRMF